MCVFGLDLLLFRRKKAKKITIFSVSTIPDIGGSILNTLKSFKISGFENFSIRYSQACDDDDDKDGGRASTRWSNSWQAPSGDLSHTPTHILHPVTFYSFWQVCRCFLLAFAENIQFLFASMPFRQGNEAMSWFCKFWDLNNVTLAVGVNDVDGYIHVDVIDWCLMLVLVLALMLKFKLLIKSASLCISSENDGYTRSWAK